MQNLNEYWFVAWKNEIRNLVNFDARSRKPNLHLDWLLVSKAFKFLDEKLRKSYVSWYWRVTQSLKKNWPFGSKNDEFGEFWCEQWQVWKFALWFATFVESILCLSHKSTDELCVTTLKNDAKFEEELTCALKNDMKNLADFIPTLATLKVCALMGSFWSKYIMFERKNYRGIMCHDTKGWCNI